LRRKSWQNIAEKWQNIAEKWQNIAEKSDKILAFSSLNSYNYNKGVVVRFCALQSRKKYFWLKTITMCPGPNFQR
jgi:hypothetical protein